MADLADLKITIVDTKTSDGLAWSDDSRPEIDTIEDVFIAETREKHRSYIHHCTVESPRARRDSINITISVQESDRNNPETHVRPEPRSPSLLCPLVYSITQVLKDYEGKDGQLVSASEAQRQQREVKKFGIETAAFLAQRRISYHRRLQRQLEERDKVVNELVCKARQEKLHQIQSAHQMSKRTSSSLVKRRAQLLKRCAFVAEKHAREDANLLVSARQFISAVSKVFGSEKFY